MSSTADLFSKIPSDDSDSDTPEKCRRRRRRRIEMRRMRIASSSRFCLPQFWPLSPRDYNYDFFSAQKQCFMDQEISSKRQSSSDDNLEGPAAPLLVQNPMPDFGFMSIEGLSKSRDDPVFVKEKFCQPDIFGGRTLHFFAVYDGRGGSHVCKEMIHKIMVEELMRVYMSKANTNSMQENGELEVEEKGKEEDEWEDLLRVAVEKSFQRMDQVALSMCACGKTGYTSVGQPMDRALAWSTAVVALVSHDRIMVVNCGDSRAVLCRDGRAVPLSLGHKVERAGELERIRAAGGKLIYHNGVRVYGALNMSHSLGDNMLKRVVTSPSQPEISIAERSEAEDECLIVASDSLWEVLSDDLACQVASTCLCEGSAATTPRSRYSGRPFNDDGARPLFPSKSNFAAAILCRLALARGSHDGITVTVIGLGKRK